MKVVSSLLLSLLMSPTCLANSPVYTTSEGKSSPIPEGVLDPTTHCGLNLEACSKNKENGFCRDIISFASARAMMNFLAGVNKEIEGKAARDAGKKYLFLQKTVPGTTRLRSPETFTAQEKEFLKNKEEIDSYAKKKKDYIQKFVAVGITRSQINNIPFPGQHSGPGFYDSQEFRCKNVSEPSTPLYTATDGSSSPIPAGVLDSTTKCGLNLEVCWVKGVSLWHTVNPFCRDIKKLAGLKNEIEEKKGENIASLTSQLQDYIDALEAIGLSQEQIENIPLYDFEEQRRENMDQNFLYCEPNSTPNTYNKPPKKTFKEKVVGFFRGNKGQK